MLRPPRRRPCHRLRPPPVHLPALWTTAFHFRRPAQGNVSCKDVAELLLAVEAPDDDKCARASDRGGVVLPRLRGIPRYAGRGHPQALGLADIPLFVFCQGEHPQIRKPVLRGATAKDQHAVPGPEVPARRAGRGGRKAQRRVPVTRGRANAAGILRGQPPAQVNAQDPAPRREHGVPVSFTPQLAELPLEHRGPLAGRVVF
mmetsp:Transcript_5278/g.12856  ORF Transcript_5278/g.12856 Transcript_5278/m.12856 type:complete len:202 (+) Transcript_5278:655-1260(+)